MKRKFWEGLRMVKQFVYKIPVSRDQEEANGGTVSDTKKCQITKLDL